LAQGKFQTDTLPTVFFVRIEKNGRRSQKPTGGNPQVQRDREVVFPYPSSGLNTLAKLASRKIGANGTWTGYENSSH
jgi:hypothetical protein